MTSVSTDRKNPSAIRQRPKLGPWLLLAIIGTLMTGCDSVSTRFVSGLSADQRALAARVPVHAERLAEGSFEFVGPVEGVSCQITHDDRFRVSEENATEELRRATVQAGGDTVMEVSCARLARGQGSRRCFDSFVCRGTAVRALGAGKQ